MAPTTWIHWLRTGDEEVREQAIPNLAAGRWELDRWTWRDAVLISRSAPGDWFTVSRFFRPDDPEPGWYVNFERPHTRTAIGIDTFDLLLDLVVAPDLSTWTWKDEDEYAHARRIGLIDDATHRALDRARQQAIELVTARSGPFAGDWSTLPVDRTWPLPLLPVEGMRLTG